MLLSQPPHPPYPLSAGVASTRVAQTASSGSSARGVAYWGYCTLGPHIGQKVAKSESAEGVASTRVAKTAVAPAGLGLTWESF